MVRRIIAIDLALAALGPNAVSAQDDKSSAFHFGGDAYLAGGSVTVDEDVPGDLFLAGNNLQITAPVGGAVFVAGRRVQLNAPVAGNLYAAGNSLNIGSAVTGNASLAGNEIVISEPVAGNLRAAASEINLGANVEGSALLAGGEIVLNSVISGDAVFRVKDMDFGPDARVDGTLRIVTENTSDIEVPTHVADDARVTIAAPQKPNLNLDGHVREAGRGAVFGVVRHLIATALVAAIAAAIVVALAPEFVARTRRIGLARPGQSLLTGFISLSALTGAAIVLFLTIIGILLTPFAIFLAGLAVFAGWVSGAYMLGVGLWQSAGRAVPTETLRRAGLAALGALIAGIVMLVPVFGWLAWLTLVFFGLGAIALALWNREDGAEPSTG